MSVIQTDTRIGDIKEIQPFTEYLFYHDAGSYLDIKNETPAALHKMVDSWNEKSIVKGLRRLQEQAFTANLVYDVYPEEKCSEDNQKKNVKIFYLPAKTECKRVKSEYIILLAGGGYNCVCSLIEAFPTAVCFNKLGYDCFVLNYRIGESKVFPKPLEDLAAAYQWICNNSAEFRSQNTEYIVCGFSAGANLAGIWGTEGEGYKKYGAGKPKALFLLYPFVDLKVEADAAEQNSVMGRIINIMLGENYTESMIETYDIPSQFTKEYPPCYIAHCEDDSTVSVNHSRKLKKLLDDAHIPSVLEIGKCGGHGFGDGTGTELEGWTGRADLFLDLL